MSVITLTTDFGSSDWFVGTLKGVIAAVHPAAQIIDITHDIAPGDIRAGAYCLMAAASHFPPGTIHVVIVDPGVGSDRRAIAIKASRATYIGPDNGVLTWALRETQGNSVRQLANSTLFRHPVSRTFHGRDVFAPVAAHLSCGVPFDDVGPRVRTWKKLPWPQVRVTADGIKGEIIYIDRFGNSITNIPAGTLSDAEWAGVEVMVGRASLGNPQESYAAAGPGQPLAILSSGGYLEIAVNGGSAASHLKLGMGTVVTIRLRSGHVHWTSSGV